MGKSIVITPVTRIEGHAKIELKVTDSGTVEGAHVFVEEIRGFEKFLEKMELFKMPQITARICGVCPAAHHLVSVMAIERGLGLEIPAEARRLRYLLYAGHILHSHALSNFVLTGPDLVEGVQAPPADRNIFHLIKVDKEAAKKILRLRTIGQLTVEMVGGRGVHPVTAVPGGMASHPGEEKLGLLAKWGQEALDILDSLIPQYQERLRKIDQWGQATRLAAYSSALSNDGTEDFLQGVLTVMDPSGKLVGSYPPEKYAEAFVEHVSSGSYMKSVRLRLADQLPQIVGPLARLNINSSITTPKANAMLKAFRQKGVPRLDAVDFIEARLIEMVHAAELIISLAAQPRQSKELRVPAEPKEGRFIGLIEAPRGVLIHDYTADAAGRIVTVNLIVATQGNYDAMDQAITTAATWLLPQKDDNLLLNGLEFVLRCFDPCLACATHLAGRMPLEIAVYRQGQAPHLITRRVSS